MNRREFLRIASMSSAGFLAFPSLTFAASNTDRRFIFIIQRGAADGLNTVIPYADMAYAKLRGSLAIDVSQATKLNSLFALHPSMVEIAKMYSSGQALFAHAVASPYRERSHFDAQNVLETGGNAPYQTKDGWMNRLITMLPSNKNEAIAFSSTIPMALRGKIEVSSYATSRLPEASDDLLMRISQLYEEDVQLNDAWSAVMSTNNMAVDNSPKQDPASLGRLVSGFLANPTGPRVAMIETGGWDTHSAQEVRLARQLKSLDTLIASLRDNLGIVWQKTTILVATEFGRTASANGTGGTDHGTGSVAMIFGGDVNGGRVIADWPGLNQSNLYEGRDLKPTLNLDTLIASITSAIYGLAPDQISKVIFPNTNIGKPMEGLIKI
jgi:uncharacterized protein (DUF1501 family)